MPEEAKPKGRIWEQKRDCSYCNKNHTAEDLGFVHKNAEGNPDWSVCFPCTKDFFDKVLEKKTELKEVVERCNYCNESNEKYFLNMDENNDLRWFICFNCVKKAFDKVFRGE